MTWSKITVYTGPYIATSGDDALKADDWLRVLSCDTHHWQNYWVFSDVDCQLKVMPNRVYESWNCTTCNLQTYCSKHESHCFTAQYLFCCGYCQPENKGMCIIKWVIIIITEVRKAPHHPLEYNTWVSTTLQGSLVSFH